MIKITFPDGSVREYNEGVTGLQIAESISSRLAQDVLACGVNGEIYDLGRPIMQDAEVVLYKWEDEQGKHAFWHTSAHLLAEALQELYPGIQFGIGPAIENGFYYDVDPGETTIKEADLPAIEKKMAELVAKKEAVVRQDIAKADALKMFGDRGETYKCELISELEDGHITTYTQGAFTDLCRGPHLMTTAPIKAIKLTSVAGAYWRGDSKNEMLTRIYGTCWFSAEDLEKYLQILEERKARDHRKLGKELGIFMFDDLVGRGLPMWLPNGFIVRRALSDYIMDKEYALGYKHVMTPSLGNVELYKTSGHWAHYKDDMFPAMELDDEAYVLRPMNCPHHMVMYRQNLHSYRELPIRIAEIANDFRYEASGALTGIERTRAFSQNDSHIFCRPDQIAQEFKGVVQLILDVYKDFGFKDYKFRLSLRDPDDTEKYFGNDELWEKSESELRDVLNSLGVDYYEAKGEAAFYGPKLDVQVRSAIGHDVTLSTIQLDYQLPERFELTYIDENGAKVRPVVIHRAILGSMDRFIAFLIEETKGVFPCWLAPTQVEIIPVSLEHHSEYSQNLLTKLRRNKIRTELDSRDEKLGYKIREAQTRKIPYSLVIGDNEVNNNTVTYREYGHQEQITVTIDEFIKLIEDRINNLK